MSAEVTHLKRQYLTFTNKRHKTTMSEVQVNSVLSTQSTDSTDSIKDVNGEPVMSKSKARSLRRKRAKQRKKALESQQVEGLPVEAQQVEKAESNDKENQADPLPQESTVAQKKKKPRKRKKQTNAAAQPAEDVTKNISNGASSKDPIVAPTPTPDKTESPITTKAEATEVVVEEPVKVEEPATTEVAVATPVETKEVEVSKTLEVPASVYEDDNEGIGSSNENCDDCACVIS